MTTPKRIVIDDTFTVTPAELSSIGIKSMTDEWLAEVADTIARAKNDWLTDLMKVHLPADIFDCARSEKGRHRMKATAYAAKEGFQMKECPPENRCELWKGDQLLGEFKVEIKDGKITCMSRKGGK